MRQPFGAVDRIGFANFVEIGREHGAVDGQRPDAERRPIASEVSLAGGRSAGGAPAGSASTARRRPAVRRHRSVTGGATLAARSRR